MSKGQTLRVLVNARLTAAAEEIFALFERTIAEYEEELCRSKEENQRKQELLDSVCLNQETPQTPRIKEEPEEPEELSVKQEEQQLPVHLPVAVPESSVVCVKTEESSQLQQRQTEHKEETQGEDINTEPHLHSETEGDMGLSSDTDDSEDWRPPFSCSAPQMETESDGDQDNQVQIRAKRTAAQNSGLSPKDQSAPETSDTVNKGDMSGTTKRVKRRTRQCPMCQKCFESVHKLQRHIRVHSGDKPFSCSTCKKTFTQKSHLDVHVRLHTGEKPYSCSICEKTFALKHNLDLHARTHTGERPYRCSTCEKTFALKSNLNIHLRTHTGERPYSCSICEKTFSLKGNLVAHIRTHTGERPYSCSICNYRFTQMVQMKKHMKTHKTECD